jgi:hypothetical protein
MEFMIGEGFQQVVVPGDAAAVLRRAGELTIKASRVFDREIDWELFLQNDAMFLAIPHIVGVDHLGSNFIEQCGEAHFALVFCRSYTHEPLLGAGLAEILAADTKLVHVAVLPSHTDLQHSCNCLSVRDAGTEPGARSAVWCQAE